MERRLYVHLVIHANQNIHRVRKGRNVTIGWDRNFLASYWNLGGHRHVPLSHATSKSFPFPSLPSSYHFTLRTSNSESVSSWQRLCLLTACLRDRRKATWQRSHQRDMRGIIPSTLFTLFYFTSHSLRAKQFILLTTGMDWGCADWIFNSLRLNLCFHRLIILGWFSLRLWWHTKLIYSMWQLMNSMPQQINIRRWTTRNRLHQMLSLLMTQIENN